MTKKVLITYATRTGSTVGIANEIGKNLSSKSFSVDIIPITEVNDISTYQAVVVGSAIQNHMWLPEAVDFIQEHQSALSQIPVAIFSVCMTLAMKNGERYRPDILNWIAPVRQIVQPVSEDIFAGVLDLSKIPPKERFKFLLSIFFGVWSEGEHRDWNAIRAWADRLETSLK